MNYIVLDLEWNQGYGAHTEKVPRFEIVEIGAVKLSFEKEEVEHFRSYVRPRIYHQIHYMTREVTGLSIQELKKKGKPFKEVMESFLKWCGEDFIYCTWGDMDLAELQNNCDYYKMKGLFDKPLYYYDVQKLYSLQFDNGKNRKSLRSAVEALDIPERQAFHGAYADACYTAKVLEKLDMKRFGRFISVDYHVLPSCREEEIHLDFGTYKKYISREFASKELAMMDRVVTGSVCYKCKRRLRKKLRWFSSNGRQFYSAAYCPEHGWLKGKIRIKKTARGGVFVVKTEKLVEENVINTIRQKHQDFRMKKKKLQDSASPDL